MTFILLGLLLLIIISALFKKNKGQYHSHWSYLIPDFKYSTEEFYKKLNAGVVKNKIEKCRSKVVLEKEGNAFSASRKYFKISWKEYDFYMCAAPFGNGFFLSWWLFYKLRKRELLVASIPFLGPLLLQKFFPVTMYRLDTAIMFMEYCHEVMLSEVDSITEASGIRLTEVSRKPTLKEIFTR